ncbi:MAG TPA: tyrosine-protein phosphatase [Polyangiaceae bacterium]|nr:tyrosine-protein phosphatase [Polyangiaceae bacterium]
MKPWIVRLAPQLLTFAEARVIQMANSTFRSSVVFGVLLFGCASTVDLFGDGESTRATPNQSHSGTTFTGSSGGATSTPSAGGASSTALAGASGTANTRATTASTGGANAKSELTSYSLQQLDQATARCGTSEWILASEVRNSRDLGGVPTPSGSVTCDRLYRGSQLNTLREAGCAEFAALGIRSVIDLRTVSEAGVSPTPACVDVVARRIAAPMPTPYGLSPAAYIADLQQPASLRAVFEVLGDPAAYPVYFHCIYGRDRTGVLAALLLRLLGVSRDIVMTEYLRSNEGGVGTAPESLDATLKEIERLGGAEAYLLSIGVSPEAIATFRAQVTTSNDSV